MRAGTRASSTESVLLLQGQPYVKKRLKKAITAIQKKEPKIKIGISQVPKAVSCGAAEEAIV